MKSVSKIIFATMIFVGAYMIPTSAEAAAKQVYYSVGQNTNDHKTGTPTVTISNGIAEFSVPQTAPNMGVGDAVTWLVAPPNLTRTMHISGKISQTKWKVVTRFGETYPDRTDVAVVSIKHTFSSLDEAISTYKGKKALNLLGTSDLVTGDYVLNIPLYYDTGPEHFVDGGIYAGILIDGLTTGPNNYVRIYTPTSTESEVNQSQRHSGKWSDTKYNLIFSPNNNSTSAIKTYDPYIKIDGLQIKIISSNHGNGGIEASYIGDGWVEISNNIVTGQVPNYSVGITVGYYNTALNAKIWNNLIYDLRATSYGNSTGIQFGICNEHNECSSGTGFIYNNTIVNVQTGITKNSNNATIVAKNNIVQNADWGYSGSFSGSSNNISNKNDAPGPNSKKNVSVLFIDKAGKDFHLSPDDNKAKDNGASLSTDLFIPFSSDYDGDLRPSGANWDIGADEIYAPPQGNIIVSATLDGQPWSTSGSGTISYILSGPSGDISNSSIPFTYANIVADESYILNYISGGPAGATLSSITPASSQLLLGGLSIAFNLNFVSIVSTCGNGVIDADEECDTGFSSNLVAWWKFDDGSGIIAKDSSGNGNNGTLIGGPVWTTGQIGGALAFDGVDDFVDVSYSPSLNVNNITVSLWVKKLSNPQPNIDGWNTFFSRQFETGSHDIFYMAYDYSPEDLYHFGVDTPTASRLSAIDGSSNSDLNQWVHLVGVYDGTKITFYRNGTLISTNNTVTGNMVQDITKLTIGAEYNGIDYGGAGKDTAIAEFANVVLDDVRMYNRALSATEIASIYNYSGGLGGKTCSSLPGFSGGTLSCNISTCKFNTSQCISNQLVVACSAFPTSINVGASSRWTASASGGTGGPYIYNWSGTNGFSGVTNSPINYLDHTYLSVNTSPGHSASVKVFDGIQNKTVACANYVQVTPVIGADLTGRALGINGNRVLGQTLTFSGDVFNAPGKNTSGPSTARICIDNANCLTSAVGSLGEFPISALNANANSAPFTSNPWTMIAGTHTYYVCADVYGTNTETNETNNCGLQIFTATECSDGVDNIDPEDNLIDSADPGCHTDANASNFSSWNKLDDDETNTECSDPFDNDGDGANNCADPGCHTDHNNKNAASCDLTINSEFYITQCDDLGVDNDEDGVSDALDPGCHWDGNVNNPTSYDKYDDNENNMTFREVFAPFLRRLFASLFRF